MPLNIAGTIISGTTFQTFRHANVVKRGLVFYVNTGSNDSYIGTGTSLRDMSGNRNHITLVNSPTFSTSNGGYLSFNGSSQYGTSTYSTLYDFLDAKFTVGVWFYYNTQSANASQILCSRASYGSNERSFEFYASSNGSNVPYIWFGTYNSGWTYVNDSAQTNISYNQWTYAVGTSDGAGVGKVYVNGALKQTNNSFNTGLTKTVVPVQLGAYSGSVGTGSYFNGNMAIVQLYNRELTSAEVQQNYNVQRNRFGI